ncbi:MAG: UbiX family flavin prenyltransferase [Clostridiaceae bacterium]|nr:UbiX family flavin prenyltransferase [Clostridiaceae bacterium]
MRIIIAMTGASGAIYGIRLLSYLSKMENIEVHLIISSWAQKNIEYETNYSLEQVRDMCDICHDETNMSASIASGSFSHDGMVVIPCSVKTLASIAVGYDDNLISRAAGVTIKEGRKLILAVRETPLSPIHLENMLKLSRIGVTIMPPVPSFYSGQKTIDDLVDTFIGRVLNQLNIQNSLYKSWNGIV